MQRVLMLLMAVGITGLAALEPAEANHLLWRTGFGPEPDSVVALLPLTRAEAVDRILSQLDDPDVLPAPEWVQQTPAAIDREAMRGMSEADRNAALRVVRRDRQQRGQSLREWWLRQMATSQTPLVERLALLWHDHFTSEMQVVKEPMLLWRQHQLIRRHLAGDFRQFLADMVVDPAMLVYLDGSKNTRGRPNENFARELFELFTLGEGHYSEDDIVESARALTGWRVNRQTGEGVFVPRRHDDGDKTVFGHTGAFDHRDILRLTLARERTAVYLVERFWQAFVSDAISDADRAEIERLAMILREGDYQVRPMLRALLLSDGFWAQRGTLVKAPIDLIVPVVRMVGADVIPLRQLDRTCTAMGQKLFDPPGVQGWPNGAAWLDSAALLTRWQLLDRAARLATGQRARRGDGWLMPLLANNRRDELTSLLQAVPAVAPIDGMANQQQWLGAVLRDPAFQVR